MFEAFEVNARRSPLAAVYEEFGPQLPELAFEPGLVAAIDQHAAAVRDAVGGLENLGTTLVDYVMGFTDALRQIGWVRSAGYDFANLRLTAVCWLMREHGLSAD